MRRLLLPMVAVLLLAAGSPLVIASVAAPAAARTFGRSPLDDVLAAADAVDRCGLNRNQFAAAMLAPSWPETGAPDTEAPSPMTLSRYDNSALLFALGRGRTYERAFWHPGVGLWQFDSAGLGAPFTASQLIDTRVSATAMAREISARYCRASGTLSQRLQYAWAPWYGCGGGPTCLRIFTEIYAGGSLRNLALAAEVLSTGGMEQRSCRGAGRAGTFPCWRVDPSSAQGYDAFARPSFSTRTPITGPFYVYEAAGREYRHWLGADTGYASGIWATRPLGQNARTALSWHSGEALCDVTVGAGACCPSLPVNYRCASTNVDGDYVPLPGDFNGDNVDDVLWYGPGDAPDYLWQGTIFARFAGRPITVNGVYTPVVGDFDGNGTDDIVWYRPGGTRDDRLWRGRRNGSFRNRVVNVPSSYLPVAADFNGDRRDDIFWYASGRAHDYVWHGTRQGFTSRRYDQDGADLQPLAADYDGDTRADVFWYGPGEISDQIWFGARGRTFTVNRRTPIGGTYQPLVGRLNRGKRADILWYRPTADADVVYFGQPGRSFEGRAAAVDDPYAAFVGDFNGDRVDDVFWYAPGDATDSLTLGG